MPKLYLATACARATSFIPQGRSGAAAPVARTIPSLLLSPLARNRAGKRRAFARFSGDLHGRLRTPADCAAAIAVKTVAQAARAGFDRIVFCCFKESSAALRAQHLAI